MDQEVALALTVWGPAASGKTVLMAQLHLENPVDGGDWDIYPTQQASLDFIHQMKERRLDNQFPPATAVGRKDQIGYGFFNRRTGVRASLLAEDRAGQDYERLEDDARGRLNTAAGLVLLIDPTRDPRDIQSQVSRMLFQMHTDRRAGQPQASSPKDPRPIAVCVSKADELLGWASDYRRACLEPDAFVREADRWDLSPLLEKFCANYRFFPVSAVGVDLCHGVLEANTFYDENYNLRIKTKGKPFNLMNPFTWLIGQLTENHE